MNMRSAMSTFLASLVLAASSHLADLTGLVPVAQEG